MCVFKNYVYVGRHRYTVFWPYTVCRPKTKTKISRTHTRTDFVFGMYQLETRFARIIRLLPSTAKSIFLCLFLCRECGSPPRRAPGPPVMGAARAECRFRRFHNRWSRVIIRLSCLCLIPLTLGLITRLNAGPSKSIVMRSYCRLRFV